MNFVPKDLQHAYEQAHSLDDWERLDQQFKTYPVRYFLNRLWVVQRPRWWRRLVRDPYWWVRHRIDPRHRYHVMKTGLTPGYWDSDSRILHAVMTEVSLFVEGTKDTVNWEEDIEHAQAWKAFTDAAAWWKGYLVYTKRDDTEWTEDLRWANQADEHLARIMQHRQKLWWP